MNAIVENYALLFAAATPVITLVAMNLTLVLGGERGTLLLPTSGPFEVITRAANEVPATTAPARTEEPANDPDFVRVA